MNPKPHLINFLAPLKKIKLLLFALYFIGSPCLLSTFILFQKKLEYGSSNQCVMKKEVFFISIVLILLWSLK